MKYPVLQKYLARGFCLNVLYATRFAAACAGSTSFDTILQHRVLSICILTAMNSTCNLARWQEIALHKRRKGALLSMHDSRRKRRLLWHFWGNVTFVHILDFDPMQFWCHVAFPLSPLSSERSDSSTRLLASPSPPHPSPREYTGLSMQRVCVCIDRTLYMQATAFSQLRLLIQKERTISQYFWQIT